MTITATNLGSQHHGGNGPYTSSATLTPGGNNRLLLLAVAGGTASATQPASPSISGLGVTWVQEDTVNFDTSGSTDRAGIFLFRAMGSPSSGTITITFSGQTLNRCDWSLDEFDPVDTSGTNGSGAVVQSVANAIAANTTHSITLAAFADATNNAAYGCFSHQASETYTQGSGFTKLASPFGTGGNFALLSEWRSGEDLSVDCSWATSRVSGGVAVEIKAAAAGGTLPTVTETDAAQTLTGAKDAVAAIATEADTAQAVIGTKTATAATTVETDTAQAVTGAKAGTLLTGDETDSAQPVTGQKSAILGTATETDTAQPLTQAGAGGTLPTVTETDTAQPVTAAKDGALEPAAETDTGQALTAAKTGGFATTAETDAARPITGAMAGTLGPTVETDTARVLTAAKTGILPITIETDTAQPFSIPLALSLIVEAKVNRYSARPAANTSLSAAAHARYTAKG